MLPLVQAFLTRFTYVALSLLLIGAGCGVPIPEDVPLIFSGYLCNPTQSPIAHLTADAAPAPPHNRADGPAPAGRAAAVPRPTVPQAGIMILFGLAGMIGGDSILWFLGRNGLRGRNFISRHLRKLMHSRRREKVEKYFHKHGNWTLFIGRFFPGLRAVVFALCGLAKMPYWKFVAIDGLAGLLFIPTMIFLGYHFAANINWLFGELAMIKHVIYVVVALAAAGALGVYLLRRRRIRDRAATSAPRRYE